MLATGIPGVMMALAAMVIVIPRLTRARTRLNLTS
jgi:hypothetical protein